MVIESPFYPIIYVRGYALWQRNIETTVGTPYMGFNEGSTKIRQRAGGEIDQLIFESPLVRLVKDYKYCDTYCDGRDAVDPDELPDRPVFIYRYYDQVSRDFGDGERREIEDYAEGLNALISRVRYLLGERDGFGVYLVAHSMGGLICRAFLQNHNLSSKLNRDAVKKVFTYATPHNGVDLRLFRNLLPSALKANTFSRGRMRQYLAIKKGSNVNSLDDKFSADHFFSLVGTNYKDYGAKRALVPEDSDGLVRIRNAFVRDGPRAFVHRSHSGPLGIVNSEEGYQILRRFLFGDLRVDGRLTQIKAGLPASIEMRKKAGIDVSYHFEAVVGVRGARGWDMGRRTIRERCAVFRTSDALKGGRDAGPESSDPRLFTVFLAKELRTEKSKTKKELHESLAFSVRVRVPVPDYEVGGKVRSNEHFEGSVLFQDVLVVKIGESKTGMAPWKVTYGWSADGPGRAPRSAKVEAGAENGENGLWRYIISVESLGKPKFTADLVLTVQKWGNAQGEQ